MTKLPTLMPGLLSLRRNAKTILGLFLGGAIYCLAADAV